MKLKELRTREKLSQKMLAKKAQIPIRNIQAYEQGQIEINKASAENVYKLSKALNCNYEDLLDIKKLKI